MACVLLSAGMEGVPVGEGLGRYGLFGPWLFPPHSGPF